MFLWLLHRKPEQLPIADVNQYRQIATDNWKSNRIWIDGRLVMVAKVLDDVILNRHGQPIRVRKYVPENPNGKVMFYLHGGGWVGRNIETYDNFCRRVCRNTHFTIYSIEYRKSPETPFPGAIEDGQDVIRHLIRDPEVDPANLYLCGDSAGGNMAIGICYLLRNELTFKKILIFYPPLSADLDYPSFDTYGRGYIIEKEIIAWMRDQYLPSPEDARHFLASPLYHTDFSFLPPTLLTTGGNDPLQDHAREFANKAKDSGVNVSFLEYPGLPHGFYLLHNLSHKVKTAYRDVYRFSQV